MSNKKLIYAKDNTAIGELCSKQRQKFSTSFCRVFSSQCAQFGSSFLCSLDIVWVRIYFNALSALGHRTCDGPCHMPPAQQIDGGRLQLARCTAQKYEPSEILKNSALLLLLLILLRHLPPTTYNGHAHMSSSDAHTALELLLIAAKNMLIGSIGRLFEL